MDYQKAFEVIASHIDASVNQDSSDFLRLEHHHLAYWFTKALEYSNSDKKDIQYRYLQRIRQSPICHSFGMIEFLIEEGVIG